VRRSETEADTRTGGLEVRGLTWTIEGNKTLLDNISLTARPGTLTAVIGPSGAVAPRKAAIVVPPPVEEGRVAVLVTASTGDYRAGDELWCETLQPEEFARALNRDVLVPRPAGRFLFGRLINRDVDKLQILPLEAGGRQQVVANPPWLAMATRRVRPL
jgi:hypothetical protein